MSKKLRILKKQGFYKLNQQQQGQKRYSGQLTRSGTRRIILRDSSQAREALTQLGRKPVYIPRSPTSPLLIKVFSSCQFCYCGKNSRFLYYTYFIFSFVLLLQVCYDQINLGVRKAKFIVQYCQLLVLSTLFQLIYGLFIHL